MPLRKSAQGRLLVGSSIPPLRLNRFHCLNTNLTAHRSGGGGERTLRVWRVLRRPTLGRFVEGLPLREMGSRDPNSAGSRDDRVHREDSVPAEAAGLYSRGFSAL